MEEIKLLPLASEREVHEPKDSDLADFLPVYSPMPAMYNPPKISSYTDDLEELGPPKGFCIAFLLTFMLL